MTQAQTYKNNITQIDTDLQTLNDLTVDIDGKLAKLKYALSLPGLLRNVLEKAADKVDLDDATVKALSLLPYGIGTVTKQLNTIATTVEGVLRTQAANAGKVATAVTPAKTLTSTLKDTTAILKVETQSLVDDYAPFRKEADAIYDSLGAQRLDSTWALAPALDLRIQTTNAWLDVRNTVIAEVQSVIAAASARVDDFAAEIPDITVLDGASETALAVFSGAKAVVDTIKTGLSAVKIPDPSAFFFSSITLLEAVTAVLGPLSDFLDLIEGFVLDALEELGIDIRGVFDTIQAEIMAPFSALFSTLTDLVDDIAELATSLVESLGTFLGPLEDALALANVSSGAVFPLIIYGDQGDPYVDDSLEGLNLAEAIFGLDGWDTIRGHGGDDALFGGVGSDILYGGDGNDELYGGSGNDTLTGGWGLDSIDGGDGIDTAVVDADQSATSRGKSGDGFYLNSAKTGWDVYRNIEYLRFNDGTVSVLDFFAPTRETGTSGDDVIDIETTNTTFHIDVGAGDDDVKTSNGDDTVLGGDGWDTINTSNGDDSVLGGDGDDSIYTGIGNDVVDGGSGNDSIRVWTGIDVVYGGDGNDTISSGHYGAEQTAQGDTIFGGAGHDSISTSKKNDLIYGGPGNDTILPGFFDDTVYGGEGTDRLAFSPDGLTIDTSVDGGFYRIDFFNDRTHTIRFKEIEVIDVRYNFKDHETYHLSELFGNGVQHGTIHGDYMLGYDGDSHLWGHDGNDTLYGGKGDDTLVGGLGRDSLFGGAGDDVLDATDAPQPGSAFGDTVAPGAGHDTVYGNAELWAKGYGYYLSYSDESGTGGLTFTTDGAGTTHIVSAAEDGAGRALYNDTATWTHWITGSQDDDLFDTTAAPAAKGLFLQGNRGNDTFVGGAAAETLGYGVGGSSAGIAVTMTGQGAGSAVDGFGDTDVFTGIDAISGTWDADVMTGGDGNDWFGGGGGNDTLSGGDGSDTLDGGQGNAVLIGGAGADTFALSPYGGQHRVLDFELGVDRVAIDPWWGLTMADAEESLNDDGDRVLRLSDGASLTLVGIGANTPTSGEPIVSGVAQQGETLTVDLSAITDPDGFTVTELVWLRDEVVVGTDSSYILSQEDVGFFIDVSATVVDHMGRKQYQETNTPLVLNVNDPAQGILAVIGAPVLGTTLSADASAIVDPDGVGDIALTWLRGGAAVASGTDYTLSAADLAQEIRVRAQFEDGQGTLETVLSQTLTVSDGLTGTDGADVLDSTDTAELIDAGAGDDVIRPGTSDTVQGGAGHDLLDLGGMADVIGRPDGTARIVLDMGAGRADGYDGRDSFLFSDIEEVAGTAMPDVLLGGAGVDVLDGKAGNDTLTGYGADDSLSGGTGDDALDGKNGDDYLFGRTGDDVMIGWGGRDRLRGNAGNDTLVGGGKNDFLQGGEGADLFVFNLDNGPWAKDYIKDFEQGIDRVLVQGFTAEDVAWKVLKSGLGVMAVIQGGGKIVFNGYEKSDLDDFADWDFIA